MEFLNAGALTAKKKNGRWEISPKQFRRFKNRNQKKIAALKQGYVSMYWRGLSHYQLQRRVPDDFRERHIIAEPRGFAELAIYENVSESRGQGHG